MVQFNPLAAAVLKSLGEDNKFQSGIMRKGGNPISGERANLLLRQGKNAIRRASELNGGSDEFIHITGTASKSGVLTKEIKKKLAGIISGVTDSNLADRTRAFVDTLQNDGYKVLLPKKFLSNK